jgi:hypothetical protein
MQKLAVSAVVGSLVVGAFLAGVAVGKVPPPAPKFVAVEELKWDDLGGTKLALLVGDLKKGPYGALLRLPSGWTSPVRSHTGAYEAVEISGTSSHWMKGEDGTKAKKMTPGSYWTIPAKTEHVSACASGADCVIYMWQKTKYDVVFPKDGADKGALAGKTAGSGSAAPVSGAMAGSAAKAATSPAAGAGSGSAVPGANGKAGAAVPPTPPKATSPGAGAGSQTTPRK